MPVHNSEIADIFDNLADLLDIEDANPFRVRAYRNAAQAIRNNPQSLADLVAQGADLSKLPSIGKDLAEKIATIVATGRLPLLDKVASRTPMALVELMRIQGLGPRRIQVLYEKLKIQSIDDLRRAAHTGKIKTLYGFGEKTQQMILERIEHLTAEEAETPLIVAEDVAESLIRYLKEDKDVKKISVAGSYRRRKETVGDLDIVIAAKQGAPVIDRFTRFDEVTEILLKGQTRSSVRLRSGISVDLRVVPQVSFGAALHYFTGSKEHVIAIRKMVLKKKLKINEYGVFKDQKRIAGKSEADVYATVDLPYIEPELREDRGELQAAQQHRLPKLIRLEDVRGDLHCHTNATDGHHTLRQMAEAGSKRGYEYISVNDHSKQVSIANGLDKKRLLAQIKAIDKLNANINGIVVLKSIELDILEDGSLDLPESVLKELDFTTCAIHSQMHLSREKQTQRILRAMDNPYFNILAHPTGRLINKRPPYDLDLERIMQAAAERGCCLELNAHPSRLDLTDIACKLAKQIGVKVAISTDAHSIANLDYLRFGIDQARRGWLEATDVINTQPLDKLKQLLKRG